MILQRNPKTGLLISPSNFRGYYITSTGKWETKNKCFFRDGICFEGPIKGITKTVAKKVGSNEDIFLDFAGYTQISGMSNVKLSYRWAVIKVPQSYYSDDKSPIPNDVITIVAHGLVREGVMMKGDYGWGYEYTWIPWNGKIGTYWDAPGAYAGYHKLVIGFRDWTAMLGTYYSGYWSDSARVPIIFPQFRLYEAWTAEKMKYRVDDGWLYPSMYTTAFFN